MVSHTAQSRTGFSISPLLVIAAIFVGLLVVEGLLIARFWIQLAASNASDGLQGLVLDLSRPLVAPFTDARETAQESVGSFDRNTLLAAMVYLLGAVVLALTTMMAGGLLGSSQHFNTRRRRTLLRQLDHPLMEHAGARLLGTASLGMTPEQAARALRILHLDRYDADLYVIPADGGCIVAAFAAAGNRALLRRLVATQETRIVRRALKAMERRFHSVTPASSPV